MVLQCQRWPAQVIEAFTRHEPSAGRKKHLAKAQDDWIDGPGSCAAAACTVSDASSWPNGKGTEVLGFWGIFAHGTACHEEDAKLGTLVRSFVASHVQVSQLPNAEASSGRTATLSGTHM